MHAAQCGVVDDALRAGKQRLAGPADLRPPEDVVAIANEIATRTGAMVTITDDAAAAVAGVDFVHTDVWVSMGEAKDVLLLLAGIAVNQRSQIGRWVGIVAGAILAITAVFWLPYYPVWSLVYVGIGVAVLYGLSAYGGHEAEV